MTQPTDNAGTGDWEAGAAPEVELGVGTRLGRYVVLQLLGKGGMGSVYAAYDPTLDRKIAIKLIRKPAQSEDQYQRALREARALARLNHRGIVQIHDVAESRYGLYLATEWIDGENLRTAHAMQSFDRERILAIIVEVAEALAYAHAQGIIHRDVKPDNVMVDRQGRVHLIDFGIAGIEQSGITLPREASRLQREPGLTQTAYTPQYAAPEQRAGAEASAAADQFALCATWYELVAGKPLRRRDDGDIEDQPDLAALRSMGGAMRLQLLKGLAHDPEARHADMAALIHSVRAVRARKRIQLASAGVVVVAALAIGASWHAGDAPCEDLPDPLADAIAARRSSVLSAFSASGLPFAETAATQVLSAISDYRSRWNEQREQVCLATHRDGSQSQRLLDLRMACLDRRRSEVEGVLAMFAEADASLVSKSAVVLSGMSDSAVCTGSQSFVDAPPLPDDAGVRSAVLSAGNSLALGRAELLGARFDEVQLRLDEVPAVARSHSPVAADFSLLEARLQEELGAYSVAAQGFRKAYLLALEARDVDLAVQSAARAASLYGERLKLAEDSLWWRGLARAEMSRADVSMPLREIDVLMSEARLDLQAGRYRECRDRALEAKKIADRLGAAVPAYSALLIESMIGNAALGLGDYDSAHQTYVELLPRAEAALGAAHPRLSQLRSNHAQILQYLGQVDAGIDEAKRALQIAESNFGENHATTFAARLTLAIALDSAERDAEAVPAYLEALASGRAAMGDSHPDLVYVLNGLAQSLVELDRHQEALVYSGEAVAMLDRAEMPEDLRVETLVGHARAARRVAPQLWRSIVSDARSRLASVENTDAADQYRKQLDAIEIGE